MKNKKVLLRERKRHTDRSVSSTPSVILYEVGYPPPARSNVGGGVYLRWGTPLPGATGGGGVVPKVGYPPIGVTSVRSGWGGGGYPRWGTPSWLGYLPPRPQVWTDKQSETINFPLVLRTRSVKMTLFSLCHGNSVQNVGLMIHTECEHDKLNEATLKNINSDIFHHTTI